MSKKQETGRDKTVENFGLLICVALVLADTSRQKYYNPSELRIQLAQLNAFLAGGRAALDAVNDKQKDKSDSGGLRFKMFFKLRALSTRILAMFALSQASKKTKKALANLSKKIHGTALTPETDSATDANGDPTDASTDPPTDLEPAEPADGARKSRSTSQQSFDLLYSHYAKMMVIIRAEPTYTPNEVDLQLIALEAFLTDLEAKNTAAKLAQANLDEARDIRDKVLYTNHDSLYMIAKEVKIYTKAAFGAKSSEFERASRIPFSLPSGIKVKDVQEKED